METELYYTSKNLAQLTREELNTLQASLGQYLDTPNEKLARNLNNAIRREKELRDGYGWE